MARPKKPTEAKPPVDDAPPAGEPNPGNADDSADAMNALAMRIWEGQSIDLPLNERTRRIVAGLNEQGYTDTSKLTLPKA